MLGSVQEVLLPEVISGSYPGIIETPDILTHKIQVYTFPV
jgi:hypothetical protein